MSAILDAAKKFRLELVSQDEAALARLSRAYAETWQRVKLQLDALTAQIVEARRAGEEVKLAWLFRQQRYRDLMTQCEYELIRFGRETGEPVVRTQQQLALDLGQQHSLRLMRESLGPMPAALQSRAITLTWNQVPHDALANMVGLLGDGSPLAYKFAGVSPQIAEAVKSVIATGIATGQNPRVIARQVQREYAGGLTNALTTCRTETLRAYRTASHESYRANEDVVKGWIWSAGHSARTCAACWAMDGTFHDIDETLNDHPRGRCCPIPVTKSWAELYPGVDLGSYEETSAQPWDPTPHFEQLSESQQRMVLGPTRYAAWKDGDITLRDISGVVRSETWGDSIRIKTNAELGLN